MTFSEKQSLLQLKKELRFPPFRTLGKSFSLDPAVVQTAISDLWNTLEKVLSNTLLPKKPANYVSTIKFDNYPHAIGALDATLIPIVKPKEYKVSLQYLSGKHRRYGVKMQALVAPDGQCIHYGGIINGARNDFTLYKKSRLNIELLHTEVQRDGTKISVRPAILADGGYQGIHDTYPEAILPRRKPKGQLRPQNDIEYNRKVSHDRIIVERFLGE